MNAPLVKRTFTAEIIGPAGSGKSTLAGILQERDNTIRTGLSVWRLPRNLMIAATLSSFPDLIALGFHRRFEWDELKLVIKINALRLLLKRESDKGHGALLLDEGGVFGLAKLEAFDRKQSLSKTRSELRVLQNLFNQVAPSLDAVIWLDAPDAVLARRIRERAKPHRTKSSTDAEIYQHLSLYRSAFEKVIGELSNRNGLRVFRFQTDREPLDDIANKVLATAHGQV